MGTDIYCAVELFDPAAPDQYSVVSIDKIRAIGPGIDFFGRDYLLFWLMAGVRGGSFEHLPVESMPIKPRLLLDERGGHRDKYSHSHNYLYLEECEEVCFRYAKARQQEGRWPERSRMLEGWMAVMKTVEHQYPGKKARLVFCFDC
jgi:hypothetical protein